MDGIHWSVSVYFAAEKIIRGRLTFISSFSWFHIRQAQSDTLQFKESAQIHFGWRWISQTSILIWALQRNTEAVHRIYVRSFQ